MALPVIAWDYQFAPNAQKARNLFNAAGIPYKQCEQPFVLPRPILTALGITYRRVPVWSIGKDVYCDNSVIIDAVQTIFKDKALVTTPADHAYEAFGYRSFWVGLPLVPASLITKDLSKDRADLFPVFSRPDFADLRPNALGEMKTLLDMVEHEFIGNEGPFITGSKCSIADIHAMWIIKWLFQTLELGSTPGFERSKFPKVYKWIEAVPEHAKTEIEQLTAEDASAQILGAKYGAADIGVDSEDALGLAAGTEVSVEATDATPGTYPQKGKLVGLNRREIVVELPNTLRVHFSRLGYYVYPATK